jgi:hypothetical protein
LSGRLLIPRIPIFWPQARWRSFRATQRRGLIKTLTDMIDLPFETLRNLGLTPRLAQALASVSAPPDMPDASAARQWMRVAAMHRETVELHDGMQQHSARCTARLTRDLLDAHSALAVGDWVL